MISSCMWKTKTLAALAIAVLISISANAYLLVLSHPTPSQLAGSYTVLNVTGYDAQGHVIGTRHVVGDPFLLNFAIQYYAANINTVSAFGTYPYNITLMSGSAPSLYTDSGFFSFQWQGGYQELSSLYGFIGVGNDSTAVSPTNYKLGQTTGTAMLGTAPISSEVESVSGNQMNLTVSTSIVLTSGGSVTEAGLITQEGGYSVFSASSAFLTTRDVFTTIVIPVGGAIAIQLTLVVNA
jgi:hypothetical protein